MKTWFAAFLLGAMVGAVAQTSPPATNDFSDVEAFLTQNENERRQTVVGQVDAIGGQLTSILASEAAMVNAYKDVYVAVHFEGAKREHASVKAWEDQNKAMFKDDSFILALRMHLQYLLATLTKKAGRDEDAVKGTLDWIQNFPGASPDKFVKLAKYDLLTGGVANSPFLVASHHAGLIQGLSNWYMGDLTNTPEMHRVNVIGWLRTKKDPRMFEQWRYNITLEEGIAGRDGLAAKKNHFTLHRRPWLLWQVGRDYAAQGDRRKAVEVMLGAIKESPRCDDYEAIVADIRRVIAEAKAAK